MEFIGTDNVRLRSRQRAGKSIFLTKIRPAKQLREGDTHESQNRIRSFYFCFFHNVNCRSAD